MANNVNCKEMRFVIRNLIDVDDVSPATAPEILLDGVLIFLSTAPEILLDGTYSRWYFPRRGRDDAAQRTSISLDYETKVIEPEGESPNTQ